MKKILFFSFALMISSVSFAQATGKIIGGFSTISSVVEKCKILKENIVPKNKKIKNFAVFGSIDNSDYGCSFNLMFGSDFCQKMGGTFKKAIFSAGKCTIGGSKE